nr:YbfB/YjiJ family MFS transporter [Burkholderiaceae bacterium]
MPLVRGLAIALLLSFGPVVSNSFARFAYALILPAMRSDLQWNYAQAGSINTVNAFGYLLGALLTRVLVARIGNRQLFVAGMVITSLSLLATGLVRDLAPLSALRIVTGIGGAMVFVCGGALSGNILPARPQLATTTIAVYFAGAGLGLMICGVALPLLLEATGDGGWPLAWQGMGVVSLLMTAASLWAVRAVGEPGRAAAAGPMSGVSGVVPGAGVAARRVAGAASTAAGTAPSAAEQARWPWRDYRFEFASYAMFSIGYIGYMTFVIAWIRDHGGDTGTVMTVWFVLGLSTLLAPLVWRKPAEHWPGGLPLAAVMLMLSAGSAIPLVATGTGAMVLSAVLFGGAMFSAPSSISSLIKRTLPMPAWGPAMATFTVVFAAGQIVGPLGTGWLADRFGALAPGLAASS